MKSIRWIRVNLQETIKPNISNKSKNILGVDRVEQFMQRRNFEGGMEGWVDLEKAYSMEGVSGVDSAL